MSERCTDSHNSTSSPSSVPACTSDPRAQPVIRVSASIMNVLFAACCLCLFNYAAHVNAAKNGCNFRQESSVLEDGKALSASVSLEEVSDGREDSKVKLNLRLLWAGVVNVGF